jgi:GNAT superfamily N-acetyltransferase
MVIIRPPTDEDAEALSVLLGELGYPTGANEIPGRLAALRGDPRVAMWVAEVDESVVGLATAHIIASIHAPAPVAMLTVLVVSERARGRGIGARLVAEAEAFARARGAPKISLTSALHRAGAHEFYKRLGYEHTGVRLTKVLAQ